MSTPENEVTQEQVSLIYDQFNYLMLFYNRHPVQPLQSTVDIIKINLETKPDAGNIEKLKADYALVLENLAKKLKNTEGTLQKIAIDNLSLLVKLKNNEEDTELKLYYWKLYEQYIYILNNLKFDGSQEEEAKINYLLSMDEARIKIIIKNHKDSDLYKRFQDSLQLQLQRLAEVKRDYMEKEPSERPGSSSPMSTMLGLLSVLSAIGAFVIPFLVPMFISNVFGAIVVGVFGFFGALLLSSMFGSGAKALTDQARNGSIEWKSWYCDFNSTTPPIRNNISKLNASNGTEFLEEINALYIEETNQFAEFEAVLKEDHPECESVAATLKDKSAEILSYAERRFAFFQKEHPDLGYSFEEVKSQMRANGKST